MANGMLGFYDTAKQREFARDFQFRVVSLGPLDEKDLIYLQTAKLPGKEISNQAVNYMGLQFNVPGTVKYTGSDAWDVLFWSDEANNLRSKMNAWMTEIFDVNTSTGKYGVPVEEATFDLLDKSFKTIRRYNLIGIYISKIAEVPYDIKGSGKPQEFTATMAYQYWQEI
jgi:hypothetical protein